MKKIALLLALAGCAGPGMPWAPDGRRLPLAPASILRLSWSRVLSRNTQILTYKPQEFASAAAGAEGLVFVGSSARTFYAFKDRDGEVAWERQLTGGISSQPLYLGAGAALPEALVVVGDDDGALTALTARTGAVRWTYRVRGAIRVRPAYADGLLFFTSGEGRLYAVDAKTGAWKWQYEREVPETFTIRGSAGVLVLGGRAYTGFPDGYLAALNAATGEVVWTRQLSGDAARFTDVDSTPVADRKKETLFVSSYASGVHALDIKDGSPRWRFELEGAGPLSLDAAGERLYVVAAPAGVHCLDTQGRLVWRQALAQEGELSAPVLWGPYLLLSAAAGGLYLAQADDGRLLQFFAPGQGATGAPSAYGRHVYVLSNAGFFYALTAG